MKSLIVLIAQVKYPSGNYAYLTANSYVLENLTIDTRDVVAADFRSKIETDGFKITNFLVYVVPQEQIEECSPLNSSTN
jgi:hypothetical protein